ncbi:MAG: hypothetical protein BGO21_30280 [Dyadobacter sp. 50-39]|nr:MAG: hypothetical protein BGO21_30280 [Dyadobacter sp. 50-39]
MSNKLNSKNSIVFTVVVFFALILLDILLIIHSLFTFKMIYWGWITTIISILISVYLMLVWFRVLSVRLTLWLIKKGGHNASCARSIIIKSLLHALTVLYVVCTEAGTDIKNFSIIQIVFTVTLIAATRRIIITTIPFLSFK